MESKGHGLLLATIAISMFLDGLDGTIVNVALPSMAESFGIGAGDTSWVVTVYFLVMAGLILVFGRICDKGAIKKVLISGMAIFTLGSFLCGLSPTLSALLASRALQGVGAAMVASSAVMLGVKFLPREKLGQAMSLVVLGTSLGVAVGPSLGALLTEMISWHWIFFINVPVGILAIAMARRAVPADQGLKEGDLDAKGSVVLFAAIVMGLFAVERIPSAGLTPLSVAALIGCLVLMALLVRYERGRTSPVMDFGLFRNRNFDLAILAYVMVNMGIMGAIYLFPFFLTKAMGLDTLESGMLLSLQAVSMIACCIVVGKLSDKLGDRPFAIAACVQMLVFTSVSALLGPDTPLVAVAAALLVCGSIWGVGGGPMGARIVDSLPEKDKGSGSSMISFVMYFSSALGTAASAGLFGLGSGEGSDAMTDVPVDVFMDGFVTCMLFLVAVSVVSLILSWALRIDRTVA